MQYKYNIMPKCHPLHPWDAVATISLAFQMARIVRQRSPGIYEWHCTHTPTHTHRGIHIYIMQFDMIMDGFVLKSLSLFFYICPLQFRRHLCAMTATASTIHVAVIPSSLTPSARSTAANRSLWST